jgi:hypothetical protein
VKEYDIGGKKYIQAKLVLGQLRQFVEVTKDFEWPAQLTIREFSGPIGDKILEVLSILLTEKDMRPQDKNLKETARDLEFAIDPLQAIEVLRDFFELNPAISFPIRSPEGQGESQGRENPQETGSTG